MMSRVIDAFTPPPLLPIQRRHAMPVEAAVPTLPIFLRAAAMWPERKQSHFAARPLLFRLNVSPPLRSLRYAPLRRHAGAAAACRAPPAPFHAAEEVAPLRLSPPFSPLPSAFAPRALRCRHETCCPPLRHYAAATPRRSAFDFIAAAAASAARHCRRRRCAAHATLFSRSHFR